MWSIAAWPRVVQMFKQKPAALGGKPRAKLGARAWPRNLLLGWWGERGQPLSAGRGSHQPCPSRRSRAASRAGGAQLSAAGVCVCVGNEGTPFSLNCKDVIFLIAKKLR